DTERTGALVQQAQERGPRAAAKTIAADAPHRTLEMDLDVVPVGEVAGDRPVALRVVRLEGVEGLVGEDHAEAQGVVRPVALKHGDARGRPFLLEQDREIEPGRSAADDVNLHARASVRKPRLPAIL